MPTATITRLDGPIPCDYCGGWGHLDDGGSHEAATRCPECRGEGEIDPICLHCGDDGDAIAQFAVDWNDCATQYACRKHLWRELPEPVAQWLGIDLESEAEDAARERDRLRQIDALQAQYDAMIARRGAA